MASFLRFLPWCWMIGFALMIPLSLPAGGGDIAGATLRVKKGLGPLVLLKTSSLRTSPFEDSSALRSLSEGTSLQLLKSYKKDNGILWLYVKVLNNEESLIKFSPKRGWLNV